MSGLDVFMKVKNLHLPFTLRITLRVRQPLISSQKGLLKCDDA